MIALGALIAALGAAILAMSGDKIAGGLLTLTGGAIATLAYISDKSIDTDVVKKFALQPMIASVVGGFAAAMTHCAAPSSRRTRSAPSNRDDSCR